MGKALKPLVIVQLLLSIGALVLGIMLFQQREMLKERTRLLENSTLEVAKSIRHDGLRLADLRDHTTMAGPLKQLALTGTTRWNELQETKQDLANTRQDLEQTRIELATTKSELSDAREQIAQLSTSLEQRESELADARIQIDDLVRETADLKDSIAQAEEKSAQLEDNLAECTENYELLDREYKLLLAEISGGPAGGPRGLAGHVLLVDPEWNFVVIDIGTKKGLVPASELLVHRDENLVGRIRISTANETMAVGSLLPGWQHGSVHEGDYVISPES